MFKRIKKIHLVGIGGSGMSGIAEILLNLGYYISGSDIKETDITNRLKKLGAKIQIGHRASNIGDSDVVVCSSAISISNPEVKAAHKKKIPVIPRAEMLAELARLKYTVTIAGTHGKTTTTSLVALILESGGFDPTVIIGGRLKNIKSNAKLGKGEFLVAEADESDGSFLMLSPTITVVTNIDNDHLDYYGNIENIKLSFLEHINSVPFYGCSILCTDDENISVLLPNVKRRYITYGLNGDPDITAKDIEYIDFGSRFKVFYKNKSLGIIKLRVPGKHMIQNALAAAAVGIELDIPFSKISKALNSFAGVGRRLEVKGEKQEILVIDDYGHHPTEIKATISAIKHNWPNRRLLVLFQPHRFTRTAQLYKQFGPAFNQADIVEVLDIYPAGEKPIPGITSQLIYKSIKDCGINVKHFNDIKLFRNQLLSGDIVLTLGAGNVWKLGEELLTII